MIREKRYEIIKEILDVNDPMGLLAFGCPYDEYSDEAHIIEEKINVTEIQSLSMVSEIISDVFYKQFDELLDSEATKKIAGEIIEKLRDMI